ncbi:MAG: hypothetical protein Q8L92_15455, partial [Rubrivivax sp.]|nr:hypothetical protein [Rubrivivax sp.]
TLCFNGDFNWFNADPAAFARINEQVLAFDALRGNVETELADDGVDSANGDAGCGCAYPDWVGDDVVERSNRILGRLRDTARGFAALRQRLAALPMWKRVDVAGLRLAIVHGDAESLAGWGFAQERLRDPAHQPQLRHWFEQAGVDAFACSHTCLPVFHSLAMPGRPLAALVLNNGAAGMPNFSGDSAGLLTRIAVTRFKGAQRRHGLRSGTAFIDAIAVEVDAARWQAEFLAQWPAGSDGHASYWQRIQQGPAFTPDQALTTSED